jgi:bifunctional oligoribonuclease and PAP phosphatase NrnA
MEKRLIQWLNGFDDIVILRHKAPDLDAYGAQFGLYYALKEAYPDKRITAAGDTNALNHFGDLVELGSVSFEDKLVFVLDTVASQMLESRTFETAKKIILVDHHQNQPDVKHDVYVRNTSASSTSEMVAELLSESEILIPTTAAYALYAGLVGDTGRFQYSNTTAKTFETAAMLLKQGFDPQMLYQWLYSEPLRMRKIKAEFMAGVTFTERNIAYRKNDAAFLQKHQLDTQAVSRGMVNQMAGIDEVPMWANFTVDLATGRIVCELRSKTIPIVDIAKKYGGGGHNLACGCTVDSWAQTDHILDDLDRLLEELHG